MRVIGNDAVHGGQIDVRDSPEAAAQLFKLVNFIVAKMITEPNEVQGLYDAMPESKRAAIDKRDGR